MKNLIQSLVTSPAAQAFHARSADDFGGAAVYAQGKEIDAEFARTVQKRLALVVAIPLIAIIVILAIGLPTKPGVALAYSAVMLLGGTLFFFGVKLGSETERGHLAYDQPQPEGGFGNLARGEARLMWEHVPLAAMVATDGQLERLQLIFEMAGGLGIELPQNTAANLVELGRQIAKVAEPAHCLVEEIQVKKLDEHAKLNNAKQLLKLCQEIGHSVSRMLQQDARQEHQARQKSSGQRTTLIWICPFGWTGFKPVSA